ncbi:MAG TPA: AAA family ATPase [Dongiaceae bacterium]|nr:AAA family ATPase [Dongiaceae bacterium]
MKRLTYPRRHISVRVPWHDLGWNGSICARPKHNTACCKLINIAESKHDAAEERLAGHSLKGLARADLPPCVKERGTFMADFSIERFHEHPYARETSVTHAHFKPTLLKYPAYSAAALPFRWMMKPVVFGDEREVGLINEYPLDELSPDHEPELGFESYWVQDARNHRALLEGFWNHVQVDESLVFFYAKQVPLVEEAGRRVLVGAGRILKIGGLTEYEYDGSSQDKVRSLIWERMVTHSIRPDFADGFLLPYQQALEKCDDGRAFDPAEVVAFAPEDRFHEFSFATEHVSDDAAISALLSCRAALDRASRLFSFAVAPQERWIDQQLGRLWKRRGAFPGIGAVLNAIGVRLGHFVAQALQDKVGEEGNPWLAWEAAMKDPAKHLPADLARGIDPIIIKAWQHMPGERRQFLELMSRIDLAQEDADVLAIPEKRVEEGIILSDQEFIANPYLFYEATRLGEAPIGVSRVDRGVLPEKFLREAHPLPEPTLVRTAVDGRRLRALVIRELEQAAAAGNTLWTQADIVSALRSGEKVKSLDATLVTADLLAVAEADYFAGEIRCVEMADGAKAYQLQRLSDVGQTIRSAISKRASGVRHALGVDWRVELNKPESKLGPLPEEPDDRAKEERARQEKAAALEEIAAARFSVLIGPAGTGKTTLLSVLCRSPEIQEGGIVMLAPTGKARVRMEDLARRAGVKNFKAQTLAQFLSPSRRYDGLTQRYLMTGEAGEKCGRTVIVDECSMLTEEMMAALIEALSGVHRLIFVGDPRQLPPIGAGRPFADIIAELRPNNVEALFPRVAPSYAELTVPRRQGFGEREDLQLAAWFGGSALAPGEDQVFEILAGKRRGETVEFIHWETSDDLESLLPQTLAHTLKFGNELQEWQAFALSLGGNLDDRGSVWFNNQYMDHPGAGKAAEAWQLLSPVRQQAWGVEALNASIHRRYKGHQIELARKVVGRRSIPKPAGDCQIIYGDKVINNRNGVIPAYRTYPKEKSYLANGEIGMVVGHRRTKKKDWHPEDLEVEFSTQPGKVFKYRVSRFSDDDDGGLELAYALTVHKAQGSEFDTVFLVLPRSPIMLTRELLYTALTRQKAKVVILHQGSAIDLQKLSSDRYSATATRVTNLFSAPKRVEIGGVFLEEKLIHRTTRGDAVRSKSEVIIANLLHSVGISYHYEHPLELGGITKYPDFTIEDDDTGVTYYWEHCGLLHDAVYYKRWEDKRAWYRAHGILPQDEGGGPKGVLIVTRDTEGGGINSAEISALIENVLR